MGLWTKKFTNSIFLFKLNLKGQEPDYDVADQFEDEADADIAAADMGNYDIINFTNSFYSWYKSHMTLTRYGLLFVRLQLSI